MYDVKPIDKYIILVVIFLMAACLSAEAQSDAPENFATYADAVDYVRASDFEVSDSFEGRGWITGAEYFSNDCKTGFLIVSMGERTYIYGDVPAHVWEGFAAAQSKGNYYNGHIKGMYGLKLATAQSDYSEAYERAHDTIYQPAPMAADSVTILLKGLYIDTVYSEVGVLLDSMADHKASIIEDAQGNVMYLKFEPLKPEDFTRDAEVVEFK